MHTGGRKVNNIRQIQLRELENLIKQHPDIAAFGSPAEAVTDDWLVKAEQRIHHKLPASYRWFLLNYAGGEVGSEEIYSIYGMDFDDINGGDIVFQHINGLKHKSTTEKKVVISETDLGEVFFFDYDTYNGEECQIFVRIPSGENSLYANNFYEFLAKRIKAHLP